MCPAAHHTDVPRQLMIPLVSVRVQPAREAFQESLRMLRFSGGLVLIQYNGLFRAAAGAVGAEVLPAFSAVPYRTRDKYPDWRFQYATLQNVPQRCVIPVSVPEALQT